MKDGYWEPNSHGKSPLYEHVGLVQSRNKQFNWWWRAGDSPSLIEPWYSPSIGTPSKDVQWSETVNTLFHTVFMANPVIGFFLLREIFAFKARAYVNSVGLILFSYGCIQHWNPWIKDTSYMVIYDTSMSFLVRMFH